MDTETKLHVSAIANPIAGDNLNRKLLNLCRKLVELKGLKRGVKECVKHLRRGNKGICLMAADVSPVDVYSHIPVLCEEQEVPYIFVTKQTDLGLATATKNPTSVVVMVRPDDDEVLAAKFDALLQKVQASNPFLVK